jgi:hypothetical protein
MLKAAIVFMIAFVVIMPASATIFKGNVQSITHKQPQGAKSLNDIKMQTNANMESYIRTFIEHDININKA